MTVFGTTFLDYDNDGALDNAVVKGAVAMLETPNQLFHEHGSGRRRVDWRTP